MAPWIRLFLVLSISSMWGCRSNVPPPPLQVSFWYWHTPFRLSETEVSELRNIGVQQLFVRAGTLSEQEGHMSVVLPQSFEAPPCDFPVCLVINLDYVFVRGYDEVDNGLAASTLARAFEAQRRRAEKAGFKVNGLQIDFDSPTSKLEKYADLLKRIRPELPPGIALSITALPTWLTAQEFEPLLASVDYFVPQFYENSMGATIESISPVSSKRLLEKGLQDAGRLSKPFYAGLPAYGQLILYDEKGRLSGTYRGLSATEAVRHPSLKLEHAYAADDQMRPAMSETWNGESLLSFVATAPDSQGRGKGYRIVYKLPSAEVLRQGLKVVEDHRPGNCLGVVVFRFPEQDESLTVALPSLSATLQHKPVSSELLISASVRAAPWALIEGGTSKGRMPVDVRIGIENLGDGGTFLVPGAVSLVATLDKPGVEVEIGDFDSVNVSDRGIRCSLSRATSVEFLKSWIGPQQKVEVGKIRIGGDGSERLKLQCRWKESGGFRSREVELIIPSLSEQLKKDRTSNTHAP